MRTSLISLVVVAAAAGALAGPSLGTGGADGRKVLDAKVLAP